MNRPYTHASTRPAGRENDLPVGHIPMKISDLSVPLACFMPDSAIAKNFRGPYNAHNVSMSRARKLAFLPRARASGQPDARFINPLLQAGRARK